MNHVREEEKESALSSAVSLMHIFHVTTITMKYPS